MIYFYIFYINQYISFAIVIFFSSVISFTIFKCWHYTVVSWLYFYHTWIQRKHHHQAGPNQEKSNSSICRWATAWQIRRSWKTWHSSSKQRRRQAVKKCRVSNLHLANLRAMINMKSIFIFFALLGRHLREDRSREELDDRGAFPTNGADGRDIDRFPWHAVDGPARAEEADFDHTAGSRPLPGQHAPQSRPLQSVQRQGDLGSTWGGKLFPAGGLALLIHACFPSHRHVRRPLE